MSLDKFPSLIHTIVLFMRNMGCYFTNSHSASTRISGVALMPWGVMRCLSEVDLSNDNIVELSFSDKSNSLIHL